VLVVRSSGPGRYKTWVTVIRLGPCRLRLRTFQRTTRTAHYARGRPGSVKGNSSSLMNTPGLKR